MTVLELIRKLSEYKPNAEVFISRDIEIHDVTPGFGDSVSIDQGQMGGVLKSLANEAARAEEDISSLEELNYELENENDDLRDENSYLEEKLKTLESREGLGPNQEVITWHIYPFEHPEIKENEPLYVVVVKGQQKLICWDEPKWVECMKAFGVSELKWTPLPKGGVVNDT